MSNAATSDPADSDYRVTLTCHAVSSRAPFAVVSNMVRLSMDAGESGSLFVPPGEIAFYQTLFSEPAEVTNVGEYFYSGDGWSLWLRAA